MYIHVNVVHDILDVMSLWQGVNFALGSVKKSRFQDINIIYISQG